MSEESKERHINVPGYIHHTIDSCEDPHKNSGTFAMQVGAGVLVTSLGPVPHSGNRRESMYFIPDVQLGQRSTKLGMRVSIYPPGPLPEGVQPPRDVSDQIELEKDS